MPYLIYNKEKTLHQFCKEKKIPYGVVWRKIALNGKSVKQALKETCKNEKNDVSLKRWCEINKFSYNSLLCMMNKRGKGVDDAISVLKRRRMLKL